MELFRFLLRSDRWTLVLSALASAVSGACLIGVLAIVRLAMFSGEPAPWLVWVFVGACAAALAMSFASQRLSISLSRETSERLAADISERLLATPLARLERLEPSRIQAVLTTHVATLSQGVAAVPTLVGNAAIVAACLAFMAWLSPVVAAVAAAALALGALLQARLLRQGRLRRETATQTLEDVQLQVRRMLGGVKELKLHRGRREAFLRESLAPTLRFQQQESARARTAQSLFGGSGRGMLYVLIGILIFGLPLAMDLDRATQASYVLAAFFLMIPLQGLKQAFSALAQARASLSLVERLGTELAPEPADPKPVDDRMDGGWRIEEDALAWQTIELVGVEYAYRGERDSERFRLGPLDLTFRRGETVFLAGGNGSGKTTLVKLLTGLYAPDAGEIRVDGVAVTEAGLDAYRQIFSAVFSDAEPFPSLLGLNVSSASDAKIREHLARLRLDGKVRVHKGTFSGIDRLSPGERKRLALATALLEDRSFYAFDEWAAEQDPALRDLFYLEILQELKAEGRTALVVTQDEHYRHVADRICVLDAGQLKADRASTATEPAANR